jgi:hypothetical protein
MRTGRTLCIHTHARARAHTHTLYTYIYIHMYTCTYVHKYIYLSIYHSAPTVLSVGHLSLPNRRLLGIYASFCMLCQKACRRRVEGVLTPPYVCVCMYMYTYTYTCVCMCE